MKINTAWGCTTCWEHLETSRRVAVGSERDAQATKQPGPSNRVPVLPSPAMLPLSFSTCLPSAISISSFSSASAAAASCCRSCWGRNEVKREWVLVPRCLRSPDMPNPGSQITPPIRATSEVLAVLEKPKLLKCSLQHRCRLIPGQKPAHPKSNSRKDNPAQLRQVKQKALPTIRQGYRGKQRSPKLWK